MSFKGVLVIQVVYFLMASAYNVTGIWLIKSGDIPLIDGRDPAQSLLSSMLLLPVLLLGALNRHYLYLFLNTTMMSLIAYRGIVVHLLYLFDGDISRYSSVMAFWSAVGINVFGVSVGLVGSYLAWRCGMSSRDERV